MSEQPQRVATQDVGGAGCPFCGADVAVALSVSSLGGEPIGVIRPSGERVDALRVRIRICYPCAGALLKVAINPEAP